MKVTTSSSLDIVISRVESLFFKVYLIRRVDIGSLSNKLRDQFPMSIGGSQMHSCSAKFILNVKL